jgi:hypothetical protein
MVELILEGLKGLFELIKPELLLLQLLPYFSDEDILLLLLFGEESDRLLQCLKVLVQGLSLVPLLERRQFMLEVRNLLIQLYRICLIEVLILQLYI